MRMNPDQLYERVLASDASYNGRFFFGVTTTGIYCLPSCSARKPKPENIRFFPTAKAARAAGLRACKKCHPDDFARGADPVLESIEQLVTEIRTTPSAFKDARAVVRRSGFGPTRLFELFRQHYHATPAEVLLRARLDTTKRALLTSDAALADIAFAAGFESLSVFHEHFRMRNGLTPAAYRDLRTARSFEITLPPDYPLAYLKRTLSRDPHSLTERLDGDLYTTVVRLGENQTPARITLHFNANVVTARVDASASAGAHALIVALLGLDQDAASFARLARKLGFARLVANRTELRLTQTSSVFDGLLWAIIGQQINLPFAFQLKHRLTALASRPFSDGLYAPPAPDDIARLEPEQLKPLQFSRSKANYVIDTARLIAGGQLDLEALRTASATRAERTLLAIRGLGPWSVNYLMMRALGFADCVPLGDTGVTSGLQTLFKLDERPDIEATKRLMSIFSPYRSLATAHLWQLNQPVP
ncbi:MAG: AraC family transcriptional regulator [Rariglobus sp.]|jgi:AraC family transcriptional regulator of adaptative response / DNA-3-methyladenine glycosylase II|nr:AraC family transcriptional regulator [Rariglobus sp.]